jgi:hypothetical protein
MAGSTLNFPNNNTTCTAGLILNDWSALGAITEYRRSVRFILTAGHCGSVGDHVTNPLEQVAGDVVWKSAVHDFLLIRVEPRLDHGVAPGCMPGSGSLPCVSISSHYYPRAIGNLFVGGPQLSSNIAVNGITMSGASICISGGVGGTTCGHTSTPRPQSFPADPPGRADLSFTNGPMTSIGEGDSGAPLYSSNGNAFGILTGGWGSDGTIAGARYTPVSQFFAEQSGYGLAPPE